MKVIRTVFTKLRNWWRGLPQKKRVQLIASVLLIFAGTEVFVLAPIIFDIALAIDMGGLVVVLALLRSSVDMPLMQVRSLLNAALVPVLAVFKFGRLVSEFGSIPQKWNRYYLFVDKVGTGLSAALFVAGIGFFAATTLAGIR